MEQPEDATGGQQGSFVERSGYRENAEGDERSERSWDAAVAREDPHGSNETTRQSGHRLFVDAYGAGLEAFHGRCRTRTSLLIRTFSRPRHQPVHHREWHTPDRGFGG